MKSDHKKAHSLIVCWLLFIIRMIGYLVKSPQHFKRVEEVLVVILSNNNKRSTQPILDLMQHKNYTCVERIFNFLPMGRVYLYSIINSRGFWKLYRSSTTEEQKLIRAHFDEFAAAEELYKVVGEFYDFNPQIRLLIVSNDHMPIMLSFIDQAMAHGVKTLYSQHASVTEYFPPLVFDFSFLDGLESYLKYKSIGEIKGDVFLVGSPRFDVITQLEHKDSDLIGIAFNLLDDINKVLSLVNKLKQNGYQQIVVRPHPLQDKNNTDWSMFTNIGCEISHPLQENPFKFISRLSFLIAGASSIHLEAALLRIPSVIFNTQAHEGNLDFYGYAKKGLTPIAKSEEDVVSMINAPILPNTGIIRYYDAAFGTVYDGRSALLAAQFIDSFLDGKADDELSLLFKKEPDGYYVIR